MWKTALNTGLKEVRFVLKRSPEHHGAWKFVQNRLSELRMLNTNVFFSLEQIHEQLKSNNSFVERNEVLGTLSVLTLVYISSPEVLLYG